MWLLSGVALMPATAKILEDGVHQIANTAHADGRFAGKMVGSSGSGGHRGRPIGENGQALLSFVERSLPLIAT
jgi:hypothetical protein